MGGGKEVLSIIIFVVVVRYSRAVLNILALVSLTGKN